SASQPGRSLPQTEKHHVPDGRTPVRLARAYSSEISYQQSRFALDDSICLQWLPSASTGWIQLMEKDGSEGSGVDNLCESDDDESEEGNHNYERNDRAPSSCRCGME